MQSSSTTPASERRSLWLDNKVRALVSLLILVHIAAVILPPLSMEGSPLATIGWRGLRPYIEAAYLNHGYHFFAPQPGPSHLIRYELEMPDGSRKEGVFPSREQNWPRLLYHRHFMLTEYLNVLHEGAVRETEQEREEQLQQQQQQRVQLPEPIYPPGTEPTEPETSVVSANDRELLEEFAQSYADHLLTRYGAQRVTIHLVRHLIPFPEDVRAGRPLDDPQLYRELFQKRFEASVSPAAAAAPPPVAALVPVRAKPGRARR